MMNKPIERKVTVGAFIGAVAFLVVWIFTAATGIVVPAEPALATQTILVGIMQYFVANKDLEGVSEAD